MTLLNHSVVINATLCLTYFGDSMCARFTLAEDLTSFDSPLGLLHITSMPMGFTNSPAEFQKCMVFILQEEIQNGKANIFIDDPTNKGPQDAVPRLKWRTRDYTREPRN